MALIDLTGKRFGRLVVVKRGPNRGSDPVWICRCDCGTERVVYGVNLRHRRTFSCGCQKLERLIERSTKHGHKLRSGCTPEYDTWCNMRRRCNDPTHPRYKDWGGRGIVVCDRWRHDFSAFLADLGRRPTKRHALDRIDNDGPYSPENCRWATPLQQRHNSRVRNFPKGEAWYKAHRRQ